MRSVVVVFPASMCAIIPMVRYLSSAVVRPEATVDIETWVFFAILRATPGEGPFGRNADPEATSKASAIALIVLEKSS